MGTVLPQSESLRRAVQWISEELKLDENQSKMKLLNEATMKFDLSPNEGEFLYNMYKNS
jgi:hypothetical protein